MYCSNKFQDLRVTISSQMTTDSVEIIPDENEISGLEEERFTADQVEIIIFHNQFIFFNYF